MQLRDTTYKTLFGVGSKMFTLYIRLASSTVICIVCKIGSSKGSLVSDRVNNSDLHVATKQK